MSTIETTIQDVVGRPPFTGIEGLEVGADTTRPAFRTWLQRLGWKGDVVMSLELTELRDAYSDHGRAMEIAAAKGAPSIPEGEGIDAARAPYAPRNAKLLAFLERRGGTPKPAPFVGADLAKSNLTGKRADVIITDDPAPVLHPAPIVGPSSDDATQLAAILARMAGNRPLDEARVVELIAQHAPKPDANVIHHEVTIRSAEQSITITGAQHPKLATLAKALAARMTNGFAPNVWLFGPTAGGKTHAVEQVATAMGRTFGMHGSMSMTHELMGFVDAAGNYHRTPFRDAYENGGVCLLDECDSWDSQVTLALGAALSNGVASFPDGMIKRHPDSVFAAAGNTAGTGPTAEFVGRNRLDAMFLSRFAVKIEWPRDPSIEKAISGNDAWVARVTKARDRATAAGIKHLIDPRHSQAGAALIAAGMSEDEAAELTYLAGLQDAQRRTVEGR